MKKYKLPEEKIKVKFLSGLNIDLKIKRKLQKEAKNWLKFIKIHSKNFHSGTDDDNMYHRGEISFIELFFFSKPENKNKKWN